MNKGIVCAALVALGLIGPSLGRCPRVSVFASDYTVQEDSPSTAASDTVNLGGVVTQVDTDRDRVSFTADDGRRYTLDTSRTEIALPGTTRSGETADLSRGMRLRVDGTRLSDDIVQADRIRIVGNASGSDQPVPRPDVNADDAMDAIDLSGTVETVDQRDGSFVVHINDHSRTIFLNDQTDLTQAETDDHDRVPLRTGERVVVRGGLRSDGTVLADTVRLVRPAVDGLDSVAPRELVGQVIRPSHRDTGRDIVIQVSPDRQRTIHVPQGIPIVRDGEAISLYDLTTDDKVRVSGTPDGDDFQADRITVVRTDANGN